MRAYNIVITFFICILFSCASTQNVTTRIDHESNFSASKYVETCPVPAERYFIRQFNAKVFRNQSCMGIDDLLTVIWTGMLTDAAVNGASFLAVGYAVRTTKMNSDVEYFVVPLGVDTIRHEGADYHMAFFELKHKSKID